MIAGLGAPEVSQCRMTDMPSITVLSDGPAVMFGAIPAGRQTRIENKGSAYRKERERVVEVGE